MIDLIRNNADLAADTLVEWIQEEWKAQGHNATGQALSSIRKIVKASVSGVSVEIETEDYMAIQNYGVAKDRIRYPVRVLIPWIKEVMKVSSETEAMQIAWAIRAKHKKEGMPTKASKAFSSASVNNRRTGWISATIEKRQDEFAELLDLFSAFDEILGEVAREVNQTAT